MVSSSRRVVTVDVPSSVPSHGATGRLEGSAQATATRAHQALRQPGSATKPLPPRRQTTQETKPAQNQPTGRHRTGPKLGRCSSPTTKLVATSLMTSPLNNVCSNCRVRTESICLCSAPRCDNATKFCFETGADGS